MEILVVAVAAMVVGIISLYGGLAVMSDGKTARFLKKYGSAVAVLVLAYAVMFGLLPEAIADEGLGVWGILGLVGAGVVLSAIVGMLLGRWRSKKTRKQPRMLFVADCLHIIVEGLILGATFASNMGMGVIVGAAILAHELVRGARDFESLIKSGVERHKAVRWQMGCMVLIIPTAIIGFVLGHNVPSIMPEMLAVAAGFFIYVIFGEIYGIFREWKSKKR